MSHLLFFKFQGTIKNLGNKLTLFQIIVKLSLLKFTFFKKYKKDHFLSFLIMYVGGIYFINHKTKDYFPKSAGLLNLSVSTSHE